MAMTPMLRVVRATLLGAVLASLLARSVFADAAPVQLMLTYMPSVSNSGTTSATGIAELVMSEGEVRIKTADLPRLDDGQQYVAWVVNSRTNDFERLGSFNTAESTGAVDYEKVEPDAVPDKGWNLLLITIEGDSNPDKPSNQHSIAGLFPSADDAPLPVKLPNTGGAPDLPPTAGVCGIVDFGCKADALSDHVSMVSQSEWLSVSVLAGLLLSVTFGAGYVLGMRRQ